MFKYKNSIKDILSFKIMDNNLAFNKLDESLFFNFEKVTENTISYFFFEKYFCYNTLDGDTVFWDIEVKRAFKLGFRFNGNSYSNNTFLTSFDSKLEPNNIWTSRYVLYQLFPLKKLYEVPNRHIGSGVRFDNKVIRAADNIINCLSLDTGTYEWTVDLTHLGFMHPEGYYQNARVRSIWGITSDILVLSTYGDTLVGIDLKSGVIVWDLPFSKGLYPPDYQGNRWCWHLEGSYLYILQHHYLLRFDTQTQTIETLWTGNPRYKIEHATYTPEYIYFTAIDKDLSLIVASIIGVFDRQKCEIIWQYDTCLPISRPLETDGKHIYCHDDGNTLHIFEKIE